MEYRPFEALQKPPVQQYIATRYTALEHALQKLAMTGSTFSGESQHKYIFCACTHVQKVNAYYGLP